MSLNPFDDDTGLGPDGASALVAELAARHGARTVILYGSRARGQGRPDSDIDVLALRPGAGSVRDTRIWRGMWLDAFSVGEDTFAVTEEYLRLEGGRVLNEVDGRGAAILAEVEALVSRGPQLPPEELAADRAWLYRMLERIAAGGVLGDARRAQLQEQLLPAWFGLRKRWFRGLPAALATLAVEAPADRAIIARALAQSATPADLRAAVDCVAGANLTERRTTPSDA